MTTTEHARWMASQAPPPPVEALDAALDALDELEREREEEGGGSK